MANKAQHNGKLKVQTVVYLEPAQAEALKKLSKASGVPQQVYLRRSVEALLKQHGYLPSP